jgi:transketolase
VDTAAPRAHARGRLAWGPEALAAKALDVRRDVLTLLTEAGTGHTGGPLGIADFGTALFFHEMTLDPREPRWEGRDFWHFSCGHVTPVIYSLMAERGYFPLADLLRFRQFDGHCQGHPSAHDTPGIEISSGSLGQGLSVGVGVALAARLDRHARRVHIVCSDGEQQEGSIWEAAMAAGHFRLDNLVAIVDYNDLQIDGRVEDVMGVAPLADKYRAFRWHVLEVDGHDTPALLSAFAEARATKGRPSVILARTVMGKGVSFMEGDYRWHGKPPKRDEGERALAELGTSFEAWRARLLAGGAEADRGRA